MKISEREMILLTLLTGTILFGGTWYISTAIPEYKNKQIEIERLEAQLINAVFRCKRTGMIHQFATKISIFDIKQNQPPS